MAMTEPTEPAEPSGPTPGGSSSRGWMWAAIALGAVLIAVLIVWTIDRDSDDNDSGEATASPSAAPSPTATQQTTTPPSAGCAPTSEQTPAGADTADIVDVDGDGRNDMAWITGGAGRTFGVTTASGATFSHTIDSDSPLPAAAIVNIVGDDDDPIALVDVGREVLLYSLVDCAVTVTQNAEGAPYTFDKGFTGFGTGVGCTDVNGTLQLAGLNAMAIGETYTVERTFIELTDGARQARNGETTVVAEGAAADDPVVTTAQETSCGELVAGRDGPVESET